MCISVVGKQADWFMLPYIRERGFSKESIGVEE